MDRVHFPERIQTQRLKLLRHELVKAEQMFGLIDADRARLSQFLPWVQWTTSVKDERAYVDAVSAQWDNHEFFDYAMFKDDEYLGNIGVHTINWMTATGEIGYWILGAHEGQGFVSEACARLTELCFERGFHRVEIRCDPENARSARVPRRLGFRLEGCLRENAVNQYGQHHDTLVFSKLNEPAREPAPARPECIKHWAESIDGPQSFYPESLEIFGSIARLGGTLGDFEVQHLVLPTGQRSWWPHAERARNTLVFTLEGRPDLWLDGVLHPVAGGDVITLKAGTGISHTIINNSPGDARLLIIRSRASTDDAVHFPLHIDQRNLFANWWESPPQRALGGDRPESTVANSPVTLA